MLLKRSPKLKLLSVAHCEKLSDSVFGLITKYLEHLEILDLWGTKITDAGTEKIGNYARCLQISYHRGNSTNISVNIKNCPKVSYNGLVSLKKAAPMLTKVKSNIDAALRISLEAIKERFEHKRLSYKYSPENVKRYELLANNSQ